MNGSLFHLAPLEFSFLFIAPLFYYIVYVPLSGVSYILMKVAGAHVGVGFARGFLDLVIYGGVPVAKGTRFYFAFPIAFGEAIITFVLFSLGIKKFNWETPCRGANKIELMSKIKYKALKGQSGAVDEETASFIEAYGDSDNLADINACATRLRITVIDAKLVNKDALKTLGSMGFIEKGNASQCILGGKESIVADKMKAAIDSAQVAKTG